MMDGARRRGRGNWTQVYSTTNSWTSPLHPTLSFLWDQFDISTPALCDMSSMDGNFSSAEGGRFGEGCDQSWLRKSTFRSFLERMIRFFLWLEKSFVSFIKRKKVFNKKTNLSFLNIKYNFSYSFAFVFIYFFKKYEQIGTFRLGF